MGFVSANGPTDVKWIRPDGQPYRSSPGSRSAGTARGDQANAWIVIVLTLACTTLALFDLFLLAVGS